MTYDLVVVGGGINGVGIAADAAGRGLSVLLAEMGDLGGAHLLARAPSSSTAACATSSTSSSAWCARRCSEREVLLAKAPHIVWPQRFVLPQVAGGRSGLAAARRALSLRPLGCAQAHSGSPALDLNRDPAGRPLRAGAGARLCLLGLPRGRCAPRRSQCARGGRQRARSSRRARASRAWSRENGAWRVVARETHRRARGAARAPSSTPRGLGCRPSPTPSTSAADMRASRVRLVKGSHIVVPRIKGADDAYLCQSADGRVVFAIPYEEDFTLIGTTDVPYAGDPGAVAHQRRGGGLPSRPHAPLLLKPAPRERHRLELCRRAPAL